MLKSSPYVLQFILLVEHGIQCVQAHRTVLYALTGSSLRQKAKSYFSLGSIVEKKMVIQSNIPVNVNLKGFHWYMNYILIQQLTLMCS